MRELRISFFVTSLGFLVGFASGLAFSDYTSATIEDTPAAKTDTLFIPPTGWIDLFDLECRHVIRRDNDGAIVR